MARGELQSVVVSKALAKRARDAAVIAREFGARTTKAEATSTSFRFRQKSPRGLSGFRTFTPRPGVALVYGQRNPKRRRVRKAPARRRNAGVARAVSLAPGWWLATLVDGRRELIHRDRWGAAPVADYLEAETGLREGWYRLGGSVDVPIAAAVKLAAKADRSLRPIVRRNPATRTGPKPGGVSNRYVNVLVRWHEWPFRGSPTIETNRPASDAMAAEIVALGRAALDRAWNAGNTADDSVKFAVRTMRQHPATKRVAVFVGNPRRRNGPVSAQRKSALAAIWKVTPRDYRSTSGGVRQVLVLRAAGTTLVPLAELTDAEIAARVRRGIEQKFRRNATRRNVHPSAMPGAEYAEATLYRGKPGPQNARDGWSYLEPGAARKAVQRAASYMAFARVGDHATVRMGDPRATTHAPARVVYEVTRTKNPRKPAPVSPRQVALLPEELDDPRQLTLIAAEQQRKAAAWEAHVTRKQVRPLFENRRRRANPHHAVVLSPAEFRAWGSERDRGGPVHQRAITRAHALARKCGCQVLITGPRGQVLGYIRP